MCAGKIETERERAREGENGRERESVCVCVCVCVSGQASEVEREVERERGEKVPNTRKTRAPYFCKSGFIRKARVVRRDVELPELPILYKKTFTARGGCVTHSEVHTHSHYTYVYIARLA